ncbi:TPA: hypothetical protein RQN23_002907 [Aeromonas veronii]|nr:hypothetical protein [Aeromonas veronii]
MKFLFASNLYISESTPNQRVDSDFFSTSLNSLKEVFELSEKEGALPIFINLDFGKLKIDQAIKVTALFCAQPRLPVCYSKKASNVLNALDEMSLIFRVGDDCKAYNERLAFTGCEVVPGCESPSSFSVSFRDNVADLVVKTNPMDKPSSFSISKSEGRSLMTLPHSMRWQPGFEQRPSYIIFDVEAKATRVLQSQYDHVDMISASNVPLDANVRAGALRESTFSQKLHDALKEKNTHAQHNDSYEGMKRLIVDTAAHGGFTADVQDYALSLLTRVR